MIGQGRIHERFLSFEGFDGATTGQSIFDDVALDHFREQFRNCTQPKSMPSVPSIQRFSQNELSAIGVVAQVQPVVDFTPTLRALRDRCSRFPGIHTPDHNIHPVQSSFGVEPFRIPSQSRPQNRFNRLARTTDLYRPISD